MRIDHLSVSRVQVWNECQQKYKYKYHLRLASMEEEPIYFAYGDLVHTIAEHYVINKGEINISEVANRVFNGTIPLENEKEPPKLSNEYKEKLINHLRSVKRLTDQFGFEGYTEYEFNFDLLPPEGKNVYGFIDRLLIKDDKAWILDYKTTKKGKWRKNLYTVTGDLQLRTYAMIVRDTFNIQASNIKTALYYLEGGDLVGATFNEESLNAVKKDLLDIYLQIERKEPDTVVGNVGEWCRRCDYRKTCPFYR